MPINGASVRGLFESFRGGKCYEGVSGDRGFIQFWRDSLGISQNHNGSPVIENAMIRPSECSVRELAESIVGPDYVRSLGNPSVDPMYDLLEAGGEGAVVPGNFPNISVFSAAVAGMLEAQVLEAYRRPQYIADQVCTVRPTRLRQDKMPGISRNADDAELMNPGTAHPRTQFEERWVLTPETQKRGLAIDVSKEAVFFDRTNQLLQMAENIGDSLALNKEKRVMAILAGNSDVYNYRGTTYATYLTAGNWINDHSNELLSWENVDENLTLFSNMTDQETGERITVVPDTMLVAPGKKLTAKRVNSATEVRSGDITTGTGAQTLSANPLDNYTIYDSPFWHQAVVDGGASSANAQKWWLHFERARAFAYMENWSMLVRRANATDYQVLDNDLVLSIFANEMGAATVLDPRYVVRSKN